MEHTYFNPFQWTKKREDIASCLLVGGEGVLSVSFEKERQTDLVIDPVKELVLEGI